MHHRSHGKGVSVQGKGYLCPGGPLSRMVSVQGVLCPPGKRPLYNHERVVRILLECILVISDVLWTDVFRRFIAEATKWAVDPFVWTGCKFSFFVMFFGFNFSAANLVILSVEKFIALYFPLRSKSICTVRMARRASVVTCALCLVWAVQFYLTGKPVKRQNGTICSQGPYHMDLDYFMLLYNVIVPVTYPYGPIYDHGYCKLCNYL